MTSKKGRVLVTGGAGLIGSHLVDLLVERGYEVTILDNLEPQTHPNGKPSWLNPNARFIQGDVRHKSDWQKALEGVRFVFHQAAFGGFTQEISKYAEVNVSGTARLFEEIATGKYPVTKVVVASSQAVYAEGAYECQKDGRVFPPIRSIAQLRKKEWELSCPKCGSILKPCPTPEEKLREGETPYALSKEFEERLALSLGRQMGIPVVALRYAVTYGPRQSIFNPYTGVVSIFSTRILNNLPPFIYEDGQQTRDFIFVKDVVEANLFVMENEKANFQVFNVGTGKATPVKELAKRLCALYGKSLQPEASGKFRRGDVRHMILDSQKLNDLGFFVATPLEEGLKRFTDWMKMQEQIEDYFTEAFHRLTSHGVVYG
jgi:dTDP-L-rhamnose 4-epimerase